MVILPESVGRAGQANAPVRQPTTPLGSPVPLGGPRPIGAPGRPSGDGDSQ